MRFSLLALLLIIAGLNIFLRDFDTSPAAASPSAPPLPVSSVVTPGSVKEATDAELDALCARLLPGMSTTAVAQVLGFSPQSEYKDGETVTLVWKFQRKNLSLYHGMHGRELWLEVDFRHGVMQAQRSMVPM